VLDGTLGVVFPARIRLVASRLRTETGVSPMMQPGMAATVEIVTGRRRVIDYLLSPIARAAGTAGRER